MSTGIGVGHLLLRAWTKVVVCLGCAGAVVISDGTIQCGADAFYRGQGRREIRPRASSLCRHLYHQKRPFGVAYIHVHGSDFLTVFPVLPWLITLVLG